MKKKVLSVLLALVTVLSLIPAAAFGAVVKSGTCGTNATWTLDTAGTLTVSGSGAIQDYTDAARPAWQSLSVKKVVVEQGITTVGKYAFADMSGITQVVLPAGLTHINAWAFADSDGFSALTLPDTLKFIGREAFAGCDGFRELWLPDSLTSLSTYVFKNCANLEVVYLSKGLTTLPEGTFQNCGRLRLVMMHPTTKTVGTNAFAACDSLAALYWLGQPEQLQNLTIQSGNDAFAQEANVYLAVMPTKHPANATTSVGGKSVTFTADASRSDARFLWYMLPPNGEQWVTAESLSGYRTKTLTVPAQAQYHGYQFLCHISVNTANYGTMEAVTDPALMTVVAAPSIAVQPRGVKVQAGQQAVVTFEARGTGLTYEWYYAESGSDTYKKTTAFTGPKYEVEMTEARAGRRIYCVVTDRYGATAQTDTVTLAMPSNLAITSQPRSVMAGDGKDAAVTVKASGLGLKYQWYWAPAGSDKFTLTTSFTGSTYSVAMNAERDGRRVYCEVSDRYGNTVTSDIATLTMAPRPVITVQPTNTTAQEGETATVTFQATGEDLTYVWYSASYGSPTFYPSTAFDGPTYSVEMNESRHNRRVYCEVTDKYGVTVRTDTVTLRMAADLQIVTQPTDVAVPLGQKATVRVEVKGEGLKYAWYYAEKGSSTFYLTTAFTGPEYSVEMTQARDGRRLYCKIVDRYGQSVTTDTVTLRMDVVPLSITKQPVNVSAARGEMATVTLEAAGEGLKYAWYYSDNNGGKYYKTTAFTGPKYEVEMTDTRDGRLLYCVVTDRYGDSITSDTVKLTMAQGPALAVTQQPADVTVAKGDMATVTVKATGEGLKYQWYWANAGSDKFTLTTSFTGSTYSVEMNDDRNGRRVYCVITDQYGNSVQSDTATLSMISGVTITAQPQSVTVASGQMATVTLEASGVGLKYAWYYAAAGSSKYYQTTAFTGPEYSVEMNESRDGRRIYCVITDQYGNSVQSDTVTLTMAAAPLTVTRQPADVTVAKGKKATVSLEATGEGLKYQWYWANAGSEQFALTTAFTGNTYSVEMTADRDGRRVYCVITDKYGNKVQTDTATLSMQGSLKITVQPKTVTTPLGGMATVTLEASGQGLKYAWYYSDNGGSKYYKTTAFTGPKYEVEMTEARAGRRVYCVVTDKYGNKVQSATVTLRMAPAITADAKSVAVAKGQKATVTVKAIGEGLKYQWYWANAGSEQFALTTAFTGNTYSVEMTADRDGRRIYCVITDKYGNKVQSATATLTMK